MQNWKWLCRTIVIGAVCVLTLVKSNANAGSTDPAPSQAACPASLDVQDFLTRHAQAFGSKEAVEHAFPRSFTGVLNARGLNGAVDIVVENKNRFSHATVINGMLSASGVDTKGPWTFDYAGVPMRLRADEDVDLAFSAWMLARDYADSFDPKRDAVRCRVDAGKALITLRYHLPNLGNPELSFSSPDATLLSVTYLGIQGRPNELHFRNWSDADLTGVRWPLEVHSKDAAGGESLVTLTKNSAGIACPPGAWENCLAPPQSRLRFTWPKEDPVLVPSSFFLEEVLLQAKVGGRAFWGLVDSGASVAVIDSSSPLAGLFQPAVNRDRSTTAAPHSFPFGEINAVVDLGGLAVEHLPAAAVPMPALDQFGERRPETTIGYPLFFSMPVRIDYARKELLLAKNGQGLHSKNAVPIPLQYLGGSVVAEARIDGVSGWFVLDSGDSETLDLFQDWAEAHGFPGSRPVYTIGQQAEVGEGKSDEQRMRPATFEFGPIRITEPLVAIAAARSPSERIAGQIGNGVLARCAAIVFDIEHRTLWLEPPCNRDLPEDLAGWSLTRKDSDLYPDHPWVVGTLTPGGSADLAGIKTGDRILQLNGRSAILDVATFESTTKQAPGTEVPVVIVRGDMKKEVTLRLVRLLSHQGPGRK